MNDRNPNGDPLALNVTVTRSAGDDRAVLVLIDTNFEPDAADPGLRVLLNDNEVYAGKAWDFNGTEHPAASKTLSVELDEVPYLDGTTPEPVSTRLTFKSDDDAPQVLGDLVVGQGQPVTFNLSTGDAKKSMFSLAVAFGEAKKKEK